LIKDNYTNVKWRIKFSSLLGLFAIILCFTFENNISAQSYWMQKGGSPSADEGYSISTDDSSNTYTTGYFTGTASFGALNITCTGVSDIFIVKTNSNGIYQWAVKAGDGGSDRGLAIKTDNNGNSYVTGYYYGTATFGTHSITSLGLQDIFVAKYDRNGNVLWVVSAGGTLSDIANAITIDNNGNPIITGQFTGKATFGSFTLTSTLNNINIFTAQLSASTGAFIWAKSGTGAHTDRGLGVACDPSGNVYVTGQFTDTVTFDNVQYSPMYDAIFLVKYNNSGSEQWFTSAGGGTYNIANAISVDKNSNVYLTGNFTGTLTFFAQSNFTLTNTYPNRIFVVKYDQTASLIWDVSDGSDNPVTSNSISLDDSGNVYLLGDFDCIFNSYADQYGQGTFNSVGELDIFASKYKTTNGKWQWGRQIGGHGNNYGNSIAVSATANIYTAGSFDQDMIITSAPSPSFIGYNANDIDYCNTTYCSDNFYGHFADFNTTGNLDIFISKPFNLNRQTYDYYIRNGSGCNRPQVGVCISANDSGPCVDTLQYCSSGTLYAINNTCNTIGPKYNYLWSNGSIASTTIVSTTGYYSVTQTSVDGCFISKDTVYVIIHAPPPAPCISDNVVINTNSTNPLPIRLCDKSVILTGCNFGHDSAYYWTTPTHTKKDSLSITVGLHSDSGYYCFNVVDSFGCVNQTCVWVAIDSNLPKIIPKLICLTCKHDSAFLCKGNGFTMFPYDSISNPGANPLKCIPPQSGTDNKWMVTPNSIHYSGYTSCPAENSMVPTDSGWYVITDSILRQNVCGANKMAVHDSVFVRIYPLPPPINLVITGNSQLCSGDSEWVSVSGYSTFKWSNGSTMDSIYVGYGSYSVSASDTNQYGCITTGGASIIITKAVMKTPSISFSPSNGIICPGDSVEIICTGGPYQNYKWYGPSGPMPGDTSVIYVKTPGSYYCFASDSNPCGLSALSNTVLIELYATPYIQTPNSNICPGDSVLISVIATNDAIINWLPPLSGSSSTKYIDSAGTYSVNVTSCGIVTLCNITITMSHPYAGIISKPHVICATGDSLFLSGDSGMAIYEWEPGNIFGQSIVVKKSGTYTLTATDAFGCSATSAISISPPLKATISSVLNENCTGDSNTGSIKVLASGGSNDYSYSWLPSVGTNATETGLKAGSYTVTVTDTNGCIVKVNDSIPSYILPQAEAAFTFQPDTVNPGQTVSIVNNSTGAISFYWTFGNGQSSNDSIPYIIYSSDGGYIIMLIAYNAYGCPDTTYGHIVVNDGTNFPNVFTPNGDGINDVYYFVIKGAMCMHCDIYNRWGVLIYQLNSVEQGWPGTVIQTGMPASDGVYYYILDYCDWDLVHHKRDGFIQLIRNK
jgi:gliding motility-associated-like protein